MLPEIKLKRLCQKPGIAKLIQQINLTADHELAILDQQQKPLIGQLNPDQPLHPIQLDPEHHLGWVSGQTSAALLAELLSFAAQSEIQSKALAQETLSKYKELTLLYDLSEKIAACVEVSQLTQLALTETLGLLPSHKGLHTGILLTDPSTQGLLIHQAAGDLFIQGNYLESIDGITASVINSGNAEIVNQVKHDQRYQAQAGSLAAIDALLCTALKSNDDCYGVILVVSDNGFAFSAAELKVLNVLASQIGMALGRAKLISQMVEQELLQESLKLSRDIQMSMLSSNFPRASASCPIDLFAYMLPAREVGGDFYDFFYLTPTTLLITIGDVSGKGVPAALFMVMAKTLIRAIAKHETAPEKILNSLNPELCRDNDAAMFVTLFLATFDLNTGLLRFSSGGHNPPLVLRQTGSAEYLQGHTGTALGILDLITYQEESIQLRPGDAIMLYTDGVTEAMNHDFELFTEPRLQQELQNQALHNAEQLTEKVLAAVNQFADGAEQSDDITLLTLCFNGKTN